MPSLRRTRATDDARKQERRAAILGAAEALVAAHGRALAPVAEMARHAGVAKGTVYLYFRTREEIFLALHGRWMARMFDRFDALFDGRRLDGAVIGREMAAAMCAEAHGLMLANACHSFMETHVEMQPVLEFRAGLAGRLASSGRLLEKRFARLKRGAGARLLVRAYALTLGLWQLMDHSSRWHEMQALPGMDVFRGDYPEELDAALTAYWRGALGDQARARRTP
jgi:AcrR family transcriptional regulator